MHPAHIPEPVQVALALVQLEGVDAAGAEQYVRMRSCRAAAHTLVLRQRLRETQDRPQSSTAAPSGVVPPRIAEAAMRFRCERELYTWLRAQNLHKGVAPSPTTVWRQWRAILGSRLAAEPERLEPMLPARRTHQLQWVLRWRKRWQVAKGRFRSGAREALPVVRERARRLIVLPLPTDWPTSGAGKRPRFSAQKLPARPPPPRLLPCVFFLRSPSQWPDSALQCGAEIRRPISAQIPAPEFHFGTRPGTFCEAASGQHRAPTPPPGHAHHPPPTRLLEAKALAAWQFVEFWRTRACERRVVLLNLDETSVPLYLGGGRGCLAVSAEGGRAELAACEARAPLRLRRARVSAVCTMASCPEVQRLLPQFVVGSRRILTRRVMQALAEDEDASQVYVLARSSGWLNATLFAALLGSLGKALAHLQSSCFFILLLDAATVHTAPAALRACRRWRLHPALIGPNMTAWMQPCDTHGFGPLKRRLREAYEAAQVADPEGVVATARWLRILRDCLQRTFGAEDWSRAFAHTGFSECRSRLSTRLRLRLQWPSAQAVCSELPSLSQFQKLCRANSVIPLRGLLSLAEAEPFSAAASSVAVGAEADQAASSLAQPEQCHAASLAATDDLTPEPWHKRLRRSHSAPETAPESGKEPVAPDSDPPSTTSAATWAPTESRPTRPPRPRGRPLFPLAGKVPSSQCKQLP